MMKTPLALALLPLALIACSGEEPVVEVDKSRLLADTTQNMILPTYATVAETLNAFHMQTQSLCAAPTAAELTRTQEAWRAIRPGLKASENFNFGPFKDLRIRSAVEWWPASYDRVETAISGAPSPITTQYIAELGADQRGLYTAEYLLFGLDGQDPLAQMQADPTRCEFLMQSAAFAAEKGALLSETWGVIGAGGYADAFSGAGDTSETYTTSQQAIDELVNFMIFAVEDLAYNKLGVPLGQKNGGTVDLEAIQGGLSDNALDDLQSALAGFEKTYHAKGAAGSGVSLSQLVASRKVAVDELVQSDLAEAQAAIGAIPAPLKSALESQPDTVQSAFDALVELERTLSVDMAGVLGVTLTFNDNDGD